MTGPLRLGALLAPLCCVACVDLWQPDHGRVDAEGGGVLLRLRWAAPGATAQAISRVPLLSRLRLVVDYPENHEAGAAEIHHLLDVDLSLGGEGQVVDVAPGADRIFQVAAYQAGYSHPQFFGTTTQAIADLDEAADPQPVEVVLHALTADTDHPPVVGWAPLPATLAGNTVTAEVLAADLDLDSITVDWLITQPDGEQLTPLSVDGATMELRPPWPGSYELQLTATAAQVESEPGYATLVVHACTDEVPDLQCDAGLECQADGTCRGDADVDWPEPFDGAGEGG